MNKADIVINKSRLLELKKGLLAARGKLDRAVDRVGRSPENYDDPESLLHELEVMREFSESYDLFIDRLLNFANNRPNVTAPKEDVEAASQMLDSAENFPKLIDELKI